jgi:hypothetical protein
MAVVVGAGGSVGGGTVAMAIGAGGSVDERGVNAAVGEEGRVGEHATTRTIPRMRKRGFIVYLYSYVVPGLSGKGNCPG